jgi:hypothetical protein
MNAGNDSLLTVRWRDRSFVLRAPEQVALEALGIGYGVETPQPGRFYDYLATRSPTASALPSTTPSHAEPHRAARASLRCAPRTHKARDTAKARKLRVALLALALLVAFLLQPPLLGWLGFAVVCTIVMRSGDDPS